MLGIIYCKNSNELEHVIISENIAIDVKKYDEKEMNICKK